MNFVLKGVSMTISSFVQSLGKEKWRESQRKYHWDRIFWNSRIRKTNSSDFMNDKATRGITKTKRHNFEVIFTCFAGAHLFIIEAKDVEFKNTFLVGELVLCDYHKYSSPFSVNQALSSLTSCGVGFPNSHV